MINEYKQCGLHGHRFLTDSSLCHPSGDILLAVSVFSQGHFKQVICMKGRRYLTGSVMNVIHMCLCGRISFSATVVSGLLPP